MNFAVKFMSAAFIFAIFGAMFLFSGSGTETGTFDFLNTQVASHAGQGNVTGYTETVVAIFPFGLILIFVVFIGWVLFK